MLVVTMIDRWQLVKTQEKFIHHIHIQSLPPAGQRPFRGEEMNFVPTRQACAGGVGRTATSMSRFKLGTYFQLILGGVTFIQGCEGTSVNEVSSCSSILFLELEPLLKVFYS